MKYAISPIFVLIVSPLIWCACVERPLKEVDPDIIELNCTEFVRYALHYGLPSPTDIYMTKRQEMAIGSIEDFNGVTSCTGTLIRSNWVLTSAHCVQNRIDWFRTGANESDEVKVQIIRRIKHPVEDLALLELQKSSAIDDLSIVPIGLWTDQSTGIRLEGLATLVGFGYTENNESGKRLFLHEPIVEITSTTVSVDGKGKSGACGGDSGGPLLFSDDRDEIKVIGVLVKGSSSCRGIDVYIRVDAFSQWITSKIDEAMADPCGPITFEGFCVDSVTAGYCQDKQLIYSDCDDGYYCGYNLDLEGYRCISSEDDPCMGIDNLGICEGQTAIRCSKGRLIRKDCESCQQVCVSDIDGMSVCL